MKKLLYLILFSLVFIHAEAQRIVPKINKGTQLSYRFFLYGQTAVIDFTVTSLKDSVQLNWSMKGAAYGSYLIPKAALENGTRLNFVQPAYKTVIHLAADETFAIISKSAFSQLKEHSQFTYNNTTYVLQDDAGSMAFTIADQQIDVLHVRAAEEGGDLWILNNPDFPLICQFKNNPLGINFVIAEIK